MEGGQNKSADKLICLIEETNLALNSMTGFEPLGQLKTERYMEP
jgi:hypothetical protein